jgi:hypothetical protein
VTVILKVPGAVTAPVIRPELFALSPAGRNEYEKVYGCRPPVAVTLAEYGENAMPAGSVVLVNPNTEKVAEAVALAGGVSESVTCTPTA